MFQKIILPLDGSTLAEVVLPHAVAVVQAAEASLTLIRVLEPHDSAVESATATDPVNWHLRKAEAQSYLQSVQRRFADAGVAVETVLLEGRAAEQVLAYAREQGVDLIMLSSHGKSGPSGWNISSVVQKIILRAPASVMVVRAYEETVAPMGDLRYRRVLAPLDGSRRAECVLGMVHALTADPELKALVVSVVTRPEMPRRAPLSPDDAALADEVVARNREEQERYLSQLEGRMGEGVETHLLLGDSPISRLHDFIDEQEVDLVVMSAHGYSGDRSRPYGSVATSLMVYGSTPLLIVQDFPPEKLEHSEAEKSAAQVPVPEARKRA
ncbi:MAG: universal stress protein [Candidatus Promineifilaceae bacterium]|nr:universal stress protein [Candidatus Promineifilaceae bacterium]